MKLLFTEGIWMNELTNALSWTLLHSLWQGLALAAIAVLVILATKKSKAIIRYNLFTAIFFLFLLCTVCTFIWQLDRTKNAKATTGQRINFVDDSSITTILPGNSKQEKSFTQKFTTRLVTYCNAQAPLIVAIWLFVFIVKMVKILSGFGYIQKIRHRRTHPADAFWNKRVVELRQRLIIAKEVLLLQSELIKIPVVVGYFKPVILVPLGLLSKLPPEQVEAVLLHELAHIRRKDYFINLIQSFAETVFFFNPALLWISELIREERENCCDDIAIGEVEDKNEFIHALVAFQEYNYNNMNARIAFAGTKNHLLNRVKRIVYNENKKLNAMEKSIFILTIVTASLLATVSFKELPAQQVRKSETRSEQSKKIADTTPVKGFTILNSNVTYEGKDKSSRISATSKEGKVYRLEKENDKITAFYVDGTKVPDSELDNYKSLIEDIEQANEERIRASRERVEVAKARIRDQQNANQEKQRVNEKRQAEQMAKIKQIDKEMLELSEEKQKASQKGRTEQLEKIKQIDKEMLELHEEKQKVRQKDQKEQLQKIKQLDKEMLELRQEKQKVIEKRQKEQLEKIKQVDKEMHELRKEKLRTIEKDQQEGNTKMNKEIRDNYSRDYAEKIKLIEKDQKDQLKKLNSLNAQNYKLRQEMNQKLQKGRTDDLRKMKTIDDQNKKLYLDKMKRYELNRTEQMNKLQERRVDKQKLLNENNAKLREIRLNEQKTQTLLRKQERLLRQERLMSSLEPIIADLKEENLLDNSENFSFELDDDKLIVNGKKQPTEVHDRYKKKYITNPKNQYKFSQKGNTRNSTVVED